MSTAIDELVAGMREEARKRFRRYGELAEEAEQAGCPQAARLVRAIVHSEKARLRRYRECLSLLAASGQSFDYYVCPDCGLVVTEEPPEVCLLCETPGDRFERIS